MKGRRLTWAIFGLLLSFAFGEPLAVWAQAPDNAPPVLAFYYTWFDQNTWAAEKVSDMPVQPYVSADPAVMVRHVEEAKQAGIDAFVVSWYGPDAANNQTEPNFEKLLQIAEEREFKVAIDFETTSPFLHSRDEVVNALKHVLEVHAAKNGYFRYEGKPVVFFWAIQNVPRAAGQTPVEAWRSIRQQIDPHHDSLWIAEGVDIRYQEVFDGHHLYSIAWAANPAQPLMDWGRRVRNWAATNGTSRLWVATVMPGYNDLRTGRSNAFVRDRRDGAYYTAAWEGAIASAPDWVIITSFNEWVEGSQIEPSQSYGHRYLDLTREWGAKFKAGAAPRTGTHSETAPATTLTAPSAWAITPTKDLGPRPVITRTATLTPKTPPLASATVPRIPQSVQTATALPGASPTRTLTATLVPDRITVPTRTLTSSLPLSPSAVLTSAPAKRLGESPPAPAGTSLAPPAERAARTDQLRQKLPSGPVPTKEVQLGRILFLAGMALLAAAIGLVSTYFIYQPKRLDDLDKDNNRKK